MIDSNSVWKPTLLLVDDDSSFIRSTELLLRGQYKIFTADTVTSAQTILRRESIDTLVCDLNFEGQPEDGLSLVDWTLQKFPNVPVLVLSGDIRTERIVNATKRNLVDFIPKSGSHEKSLKIAIEQAIEVRRRVLTLKQNPNRYRTRCPRILSQLDTIDSLALMGESAPFLITGETGCGKEFIAKHIAAVFKKSLTTCNMAGIDGNTAESELFGHAKGAFTGANTDKPGLMEQAHNGIFFLDELGDCPLDVQAKLLLTLQTRIIRRKGATQGRQIEVQFIAATNRNLHEMIRQGKFRQDLYERLDDNIIHLPPLRERPEDIRFYLGLYQQEYSKEKPITLTEDGLEAALKYSWPGNTRELAKFVKRVALTSSKKVIDAEAVQAWIQARSHGEVSGFISAPKSERDRVIEALQKAQGNRTDAAGIMGVDPSTLFRQIKKFELGALFAGKPGRPGKTREICRD